jgi:membrane-bound serine protease (ClpP class)
MATPSSRKRYALALVAGGAVALAAGWFATSFVGARGAGQKQPAASIYRVPVTGVIELGLAPFIERSLAEAHASRARLVILEIETPGGRVDAAQRIVDAIKESPVPVYAYINRRAFSAGALIALAAQQIYMRDGSVIGAATPVDGSGKKVPEKIVSAMRSEMRALAEARGLNPLIAEAMVDEDIAIPGVVEKGKLLTLTTEEAVRLGYARETGDWVALIAQLNAADAPVAATTVNWAERIVRFITHPIVAPLLLSLGMLGLLIEIKAPGFGLAGLTGAISLATFFGGHYIVGLAGLEEVLLLLGGIALIGLEVFVIPGFGIAGVLGITAIGAGVLLSLVPDMATSGDFARAASVVAASLLAVLLAVWALVRKLPTSRRFEDSGLLLGQSTSRATGYIATAERPELVGATGIALTDLRPSGTARVGDERLDVVTDSAWVSAGTTIRIVRDEGYRLVVEPVE